IVLSVNNNESTALTMPELTISPVRQGKFLAKVDLEVVVTERDKELSVGWMYRSDLFEERTMKKLSESYEHLLRGMVAEPNRGIYDYALVNAEQEEMLLAMGQGQGGDHAKEYESVSVAERIEEEARKNPK